MVVSAQNQPSPMGEGAEPPDPGRDRLDLFPPTLHQPHVEAETQVEGGMEREDQGDEQSNERIDRQTDRRGGEMAEASPKHLTPPTHMHMHMHEYSPWGHARPGARLSQTGPATQKESEMRLGGGPPGLTLP